MNNALKLAAQDAAEAIDWLLKNIRLDAPQLSGKAMGNAEKCASALRAAIQQAEAQQPSSKEHLFELWWEAHMPNATQEQAWTAFTAAVASNGVGIAAK